jgi:hypothetical protein
MSQIQNIKRSRSESRGRSRVRKIRSSNNRRVARSVSRPQRQLVRRQNIKDGPTWDRMPSLIRNQAPRMSASRNQCRIIHREPLAVLNGTVAFGIQTFQINPGLAVTFPWLSAQASGYESYKINSLTMEYRFTTNEFHGRGRIIMAPDYDSADSPPTTSIKAEQMSGAVQGAVAKNWNLQLRPRGMGILGPKRYIRTESIATNQDIKTYDIAQIHVITTGQEDTSEIGQLWLNYDITLSEPQPPQSQNIVASGSLLNSDGTGVLTTALMGTGSVAEGTILIQADNNDITVRNLIPGQVYLFAYHLVGTVLANAPTLTFTSNLTTQNATEVLGTLNGGTTNAWFFRYGLASDNFSTMSLGATTMTTATRAVFSVNASLNYS